jgi:putative addiction module component (TIGR02574 family)
MQHRTRDVLKTALDLPLDERAHLAAELLASIDGEDDVSEVEAAWAKEIERRARRVRNGETVGIPWSTVEQQARAILAGK